MSLLWKKAVAVDGYEITHEPATNGGTYFAHDYGSEGKPVGYLRYVHTEPGTIGIDMLHTQKARRRQGIGTRLMGQMVADHPDHQITTEDASDKGQSFIRSYKNRHGVEVNVLHPGEWWGDGDDWEDE